MAAKDKAGRAAQAARSNPYVQRLIADEQLRENIRTAYEAGRSAYGRMNNGKAPTRALMEDKKLHKELRNAARALSDAGTALRESPKRRRRGGGLGRMLVVGLVGAGLALALSEGLRSKVLDMLFGSEEEFDYTSTTAPATPAPEPAVAG
jgi:ferric-dicitrate binding protein FerR (iron transport regulator)